MKRKEAYKGRKLGWWVMMQRQRRRKDKMPLDQIEKLLDLGLNFNPQKRKKFEEIYPDNEKDKEELHWENNYYFLEWFFEETGMSTLRGEGMYRGKPIGRWCDEQRRLFEEGLLKEERVKKLELIKFPF